MGWSRKQNDKAKSHGKKINRFVRKEDREFGKPNAKGDRRYVR